jgi:hypothetical protein
VAVVTRPIKSDARRNRAAIWERADPDTWTATSGAAALKVTRVTVDRWQAEVRLGDQVTTSPSNLASRVDAQRWAERKVQR